MINKKLQRLRLLLLPFTWVYGCIIWLRNLLYDEGFFVTYRSKVAVIAVGNLAVGGTGKTPVTEYIVLLLMDKFKVAVLSRGYGRKTSGFLEVSVTSVASEVGDEPLQLKKKIPAIRVAVDENRVEGIKKLQASQEVIVLDDAFQHRAVTPGLNILLIDFSALGRRDLLLPAGNLREPWVSRKRADILLITKAPEHLDPAEKKHLIEKAEPFAHQEVFFSWLEYGRLISLDGTTGPFLNQLQLHDKVVLLTGIANPQPLLNEIRRYCDPEHMKFPDHHVFTKKNMSKLAHEAAGRMIITTEKDAQRLLLPHLREALKGLVIYYLPVAARINAQDEARFITTIQNYVYSKYS